MVRETTLTRNRKGWIQFLAIAAAVGIERFSRRYQ